MDRLDRLTQRLMADLDRRAEGPSCLAPDVLGRHVAGGLDTSDRERVEAHLDTCLPCLARLVEFRDDLRALASPAPVSPGLQRHLDTLTGPDRQPRFGTRVVDVVRRTLTFKVPAWAVAGAAAALIAITWTAAQHRERPGAGVPWPVEVLDPSHPDRLRPAYRQVPRTVSGVVSAIRDATANGVDAHVVSVKDAAGATYMLFAWGTPTVRAGDSVEVDAIITDTAQSAGISVYQGLATRLSRAR